MMQETEEVRSPKSFTMLLDDAKELADRYLKKQHTPPRSEFLRLLESLQVLDDKAAFKLVRVLGLQGREMARHVLHLWEQSKRPQRSRLLQVMVQLIIHARPGSLDDGPSGCLGEGMMERILTAHHDHDLKTRALALVSFDVLASSYWTDQEENLLLEPTKSSRLAWKDRWDTSVLTAWEQEPKPLRPDFWRVMIKALAGSSLAKSLHILEVEGWQTRRCVDGPDKLRLEEDRLLLERQIATLRRDLHRRQVTVSCESVSVSKNISPQNTPKNWMVFLRCRRGLEKLMASELLQKSGLDLSPSDLEFFQGPSSMDLGRGLGGLGFAFHSFLNKKSAALSSETLLNGLNQIRTAEEYGFFWPIASDNGSRTLDTDLALFEKSLEDPLVGTLLSCLAQGGTRFRLDSSTFYPGVDIWQVAQRLHSKLAPLGWHNDSMSAPWNWRLVQHCGTWGWLMIPKAWIKQRFGYRVQDVPASSHGPLAAALAFVADPKPHDVIWDPFCGAGTELFECSLLGPWKMAIGFDESSEALRCAQENGLVLAESCPRVGKISWQLQNSLNAAHYFKNGQIQPSLTITNPPFGKRVHRHQIKEFYAQVMPEVLKQTALGGYLVWITPFITETDALLQSLGYKILQSTSVDLGGFIGHLQKAQRVQLL